MKEPHHDCLKTVSILLNRAQDIEDVLRDYEQKISSRANYDIRSLISEIRAVNNKSHETAAGYLPG